MLLFLIFIVMIPLMHNFETEIRCTFFITLLELYNVYTFSKMKIDPTDATLQHLSLLRIELGPRIMACTTGRLKEWLISISIPVLFHKFT